MTAWARLGTVEAAAFWIGLVVTVIASVVAWGILELLRLNFLQSYEQGTRQRLLQRLTRDCDSILAAASVVSVVSSALLLQPLTAAEGAIAFAAGALVAIGITVALLVVSPAVYKHLSRGPATPCSILLVLINAGALAYIALR